MKKVLFLLILFCLQKALHAQQPYIYTIKADSVKITNTCDTAELIIENHTQTVPGFLFNKGRGRTEFRRIAQLDDTSVVIGGDTIHLGRGNKNFANADLTFTGDRIHNGAFHTISLTDFDEIGFKTNTTDGTYSTEMKMNTGQGYSLVLNNTSNPDVVHTTSHTMETENVSLGTFVTTADFTQHTNLSLGDRFYLSTGYFSMDGNNSESVGIKGGYLTDYDPRQIDIYAQNGTMHIYTDNSVSGKHIEMNFQKSDSLTITSGTFGNATTLTQSNEGFFFRRAGGFLSFMLIGLPASTSTTDNTLVIDNNGQVKIRTQSPSRKSATVTGSTYTVPADVEVVFVNYTAGQATITLPTGTLDREITIKNLHTTNTVIISGLDTSESNSVATRGAITVKYTGSAWVGISKY